MVIKNHSYQYPWYFDESSANFVEEVIVSACKLTPLRIISWADSRQKIFPLGWDTGKRTILIARIPVIKDGNDTMRFGQSALNANEYDGRVNVNNYYADDLGQAFDNNGGRVAELE